MKFKVLNATYVKEKDMTAIVTEHIPKLERGLAFLNDRGKEFLVQYLAFSAVKDVKKLDEISSFSVKGNFSGEYILVD